MPDLFFKINHINKIALLSLCLIIGLLSCKTSKKDIDQMKIAKEYYQVLDDSDTERVHVLLADSLLTRETQYNYEQTFAKSEYIEWLKWDAVFRPSYEILEIEQQGENVRAKVSKVDQRILFLHEGPIVTSQVLRFDEDRICSVETVDYIVFNDALFVKNREVFLDWIDKNHPELNGFIYDQTQTGGLKYLKAMELYISRQQE